jgi:hypothetical protein
MGQPRSPARATRQETPRSTLRCRRRRLETARTDPQKRGQLATPSDKTIIAILAARVPLPRKRRTVGGAKSSGEDRRSQLRPAVSPGPKDPSQRHRSRSASRAQSVPCSSPISRLLPTLCARPLVIALVSAHCASVSRGSEMPTLARKQQRACGQGRARSASGLLGRSSGRSTRLRPRRASMRPRAPARGRGAGTGRGRARDGA